MLLIWFCIAFILGIFIGDYLNLPPIMLGLVACGLWLLGIIWWSKRAARLALLWAGTCILGVARISWAEPITTDRSIWVYNGTNVMISGVVGRQPDRREDAQTAVITVDRLVVDGATRTVEGDVLLRLPPTPELRYGQRVVVEGRLEQPRTGGDFDYRAYLARRNIYSLMQRPKLRLEPGTGGTWWQAAMLSLNDRARLTGLRLVSEPHASLLVGVLLGVQSTIPEDVLDAFSATGTSHILVISGWNISVIVAGIGNALAAVRIARKRAALLCLPILVLYVLFVGATPSVVRAAVMGGLAVVAILVDRESEAWTSLLVACVAMAAYDPNVLWDIGFQLSALATAGLFAFAKPVERVLTAQKMFQWRGLSWAVEPLTATIAASSLSLPIILYYFGRLSLIAPLANVVMLPAVPFAMLFGALATVAGMIWLPLGQVVGLFAWPFLQWLLVCAQWLSLVPGAYTTLPPFSIWWVWGYYAAVFLYFLLSRRPHSSQIVLEPSPQLP